jgi:hypothetical protein
MVYHTLACDLSKGKIMTTSTSTNPALVSAYVAHAENVNATEWDFLRLTRGVAVRDIKASILEGRAVSGITLKDLTPTMAQHFETALVMLDKWETLPSTHTFSDVISLASRSERDKGAKEAREAIASAISLPKWEKAVPTQAQIKARKAGDKPAGDKPAGDKPAGDKAQALTADNIGDIILALADTLDGEKRARLVTTLVAVSKAIQLTPAPTPKKSRKAKVTA